jgi:hypothetical protein
MTRITFNELVDKSRNRTVFMIIGNGSKNQFRSVAILKAFVQKLSKELPYHSMVLYFGDLPNPEKPDIGYVFQLLKDLRKDINITMIQITAAQKYGVPKMVKDVYYHDHFTDECKYGGLDSKGQPCSNTKVWVNFHKKHPIQKVYILGGGQIVLDEYKLIKSMNIPYAYYPFYRKYKGDGQTLTKVSDSLDELVGITFLKIKY